MVIAIWSIPPSNQTRPQARHPRITQERIHPQVFRVLGKPGTTEQSPHAADHAGVGNAALGADPVMKIFIIKKIFHDLQEAAVKIFILQYNSKAVQHGSIHSDTVPHTLFRAIRTEQQAPLLKQFLSDQFPSAVPAFRRLHHHIRMGKIIEINRLHRCAEIVFGSGKPRRSQPTVITRIMLRRFCKQLTARLRHRAGMSHPGIGWKDFRKCLQNGNDSFRITFVSRRIICFCKTRKHTAAPSSAKGLNPLFGKIILRICLNRSRKPDRFHMRRQVIFPGIFPSGIIQKEIAPLRTELRKLLPRLHAIDPIGIIHKIITEPLAGAPAERASPLMIR